MQQRHVPPLSRTRVGTPERVGLTNFSSDSMQVLQKIGGGRPSTNMLTNCYTILRTRDFDRILVVGITRPVQGVSFAAGRSSLCEHMTATLRG